MSDWNFLLRLECDLHRDSEKQLQRKYFGHYSTVRDVMVDPDRFGVPLNYPHSVVVGDHLWVIYSVNKEEIEITRIPLYELESRHA
jgi:hypothetical protein